VIASIMKLKILRLIMTMGISKGIYRSAKFIWDELVIIVRIMIHTLINKIMKIRLFGLKIVISYDLL